MLAEGTNDFAVVRRAEFDFIDWPVWKLLHLTDHDVDIVNADGVVADGKRIRIESPQLIDWLLLDFSPEVVCCQVEGALGERILI